VPTFFDFGCQPDFKLSVWVEVFIFRVKGFVAITIGVRAMSQRVPSEEPLDSVHHIAISVPDIAVAVDWYCDTFRCTVSYQDETWAMLQFANLHLALVIPGEHPPHIGFATPQAADFGELRTHRDGSRSIYISDVAGNALELLDPDSVDAG
jgi:hypothetical protein